MNQNKADNYSYNIAFLKIFFSFCVVMAHFFVIESDSLPVAALFRLIAIASPMFFLISFFLTSDKLSKSDLKMLGKRVWRLYFPFIVWAFLYYFTYLLIGHFFNLTKLPNQFFILFTKKDLFWQLLAGSDRYLCPQLWFQFDLILFTLLFWLVFKISNKHAVKILSVLGIICIVLQYTQINYSLFCRFEYELWFPLGRLAETLPFAVIGLLISREAVLSGIRAYKIPVIPVSILMIIITGIFGLIPNPELGFEYSGINMIIFTTSLFIVVYLLPFDRLIDTIKAILRFLAKYSFGVFCIHLGIGSFIELVICYNLNIKTGTFAECVLVYSISLLVSWGISKIPGKYSKMLVT